MKLSDNNTSFGKKISAQSSAQSSSQSSEILSPEISSHSKSLRERDTWHMYDPTCPTVNKDLQEAQKIFDAPRTYNIPGIVIQENYLDVPLDWSNLDPQDSNEVKKALQSRESIKFFYRIMCEAGKEKSDLPYLIFLQGGPGGQSPRPLNPYSDGWFCEALKYFKVILPDQRGTGRSSQVDGALISSLKNSQQQADYLHYFLADSIVRDCEYLRHCVFQAQKWVTLGQSYGGFLTLTYLSLFPCAIQLAFTTGGIPGIYSSIDEIYRHTYDTLEMKNAQYFERYPQDRELISALACYVRKHPTYLPNGDVVSVKKIQSLGQGFGMKPGYERVHWLLDTAFDGMGNLSDGFLHNLYSATTSYGRELYWTLQEGIYENGNDNGYCCAPHWSAQRELEKRPSFSDTEKYPLFTGEMTYPWRFEEDSALKPFKEAMNIFMESTQWGTIYQFQQLEKNEVPLYSAVYYNDMYVPRELSMNTLARIKNSHPWVTSAYEHDGLHYSEVIRYLFNQARQNGDFVS